MGELDFAELYESLKNRVFTMARARMSHHRAEEVTCSTFETVWAKRDECPLDPKERVAWVIGILRNKILQELQRPVRKPHDHRFLADFPVEPAQADIAEAVTDSVVGQWVYSRLTSLEQELLTIAYTIGMDREQGAKHFGLTLGAYSTRLTRLRARIDQLYAEAEEQGDDDLGRDA